MNEDEQIIFNFPSAKGLIEDLLMLKREEFSSFIEQKIFVNLRTAPMFWIQEFLENDGLIILTGILAKTNLINGM